MLDLVVIGGKARRIVTRCLHTEVGSHVGDVVLLCTGGYSNVFYLSTNAKASNCTAIWRAHRRGALFGNPCFTQIHPTCIPQSGEYQSKLTLMSESLRNDGRIWVPKKKGDTRRPNDIPEAERDYYLERRYPNFGNLVPRDVASRNAKEVCDEGRAGMASTATSATPSPGWGWTTCGRNTATYSRSTSASRATTPMRCRCASTRPRTTRWGGSGSITT
jgi:succinate dehydrogenase / fumarate reductase flavoprotein subunit